MVIRNLQKRMTHADQTAIILRTRYLSRLVINWNPDAGY